MTKHKPRQINVNTETLRAIWLLRNDCYNYDRPADLILRDFGDVLIYLADLADVPITLSTVVKTVVNENQITERHGDQCSCNQCVTDRWYTG